MVLCRLVLPGHGAADVTASAVAADPVAHPWEAATHSHATILPCQQLTAGVQPMHRYQVHERSSGPDVFLAARP